MRLLVELMAVPPLEDLAVKRHHSQRLLKIVTGGIRELAEVIVRLAQGFIGFEKLLRALCYSLLKPRVQVPNLILGFLALGDIPDCRDDQRAFLRLQGAETDFGRKLRPILATRLELLMTTCRSGQTIPLRNQRLNVAGDERRPLQSEHHLRL